MRTRPSTVFTNTWRPKRTPEQHRERRHKRPGVTPALMTLMTLMTPIYRGTQEVKALRTQQIATMAEKSSPSNHKASKVVSVRGVVYLQVNTRSRSTSVIRLLRSRGRPLFGRVHRVMIGSWWLIKRPPALAVGEEGDKHIDQQHNGGQLHNEIIALSTFLFYGVRLHDFLRLLSPASCD